MKTLIICSHYPLPENIGSNMRTMNFARFFRKYGTVDIAYSNTLHGEGEGGSFLFSNEYFLRKESCGGLQKRLMRWINVRSRPLQIARYDTASERKLLSLLESGAYDYIVVRYAINTWSFFGKASGYRARTIVDFDDILSGSLYETKMEKVEGFFRKLRFRMNHRFLTEYEKRCLTFGASLFCSEKDRAIVTAEGMRDNTFVVPNIYNNRSFEEFDFGDGFSNENTLLFIGSLNYMPNKNGLKWFMESVFPVFKQNYPDARLLVVGRSPDKDIRELCREDAGIELHEDVPDIRPYYGTCRAVVVPLLAGGGTRIKILEAAIAGRPVLSTPVGAEGLNLKDNQEILKFQDAQEFISQYGKIQLRDIYDSLVRRAKHHVLNNYSVSNFNARMQEVLDYLEGHKKGDLTGQKRYENEFYHTLEAK